MPYSRVSALPRLALKPLSAALACVVFGLAPVGSAVAGEAPAEARFEATTQLKAMSVSHWQAIADDLAKAVGEELKTRAKPESFEGVYVQAEEGTSVFSSHLAVFLKDSFHKAGFTVFEEPREGVLTVDISNSFVAHTSAANMAPELKWTALTAGVMVLREVALASAPVGLLASALSLDLTNKLTKSPTRAEVAVSATVSQGGKYLSRQTRVYYVEGLDGDLFGSISIEPATSDFRWFRLTSH